MSKRYPLSRASKVYETILKAEPEYTSRAAREGELGLHSATLAAFTAKAMSKIRIKTGESDLHHCMAELNMRAAQDGLTVTPDDLMWTSRWRRCRQVYRIDETVASELPATELDDEIPCEVFKRLPYPIIYVETRFKTPLLTGETTEVAGFLAYTVEWNDGSTRLAIVMIRPEGGRLYTSIPCDESTTVKSLVDSSAAAFDKNGNRVSQETLADTMKDGYAAAVETMTTIVSSLLYIISAEDDKEVIYAPPKTAKGSKLGKKTNPETVCLLGARMGRAIGETRRYSDRGKASADSTGRTVTPHIRAAHWQHYWTGKRKERTDGRYGDNLVIRWIPPINVNDEIGIPGPTETIHK